MTGWLGRLFGAGDLESVQDVALKFAAPWAQHRPALVIFGALGLAVLAALFYVRLQNVTTWRRRAAMIFLRATVLATLLVMLAEPIVSMTLTHRPKALLLMLTDSTDSMNIRDKLSAGTREKLTKKFGPDVLAPDGGADANAAADPSRAELVRRALRHDNAAVLRKLADKYRLQCYAMDRADQVREVALAKRDGAAIDASYVGEQLRGQGPVTALGEAINDLARRHPTHMLAGVVIVSDFAQNAGAPALPAAEALKAPVYTVGVGPREVVDLALDLTAPVLIKKDERVDIPVGLRQTGLTGRHATVELYARRLGTTGGSDRLTGLVRVSEPKTVTLDGPHMTVHMPYTPDATGRYDLVAKVVPLPDEALGENNTAQREINVRDESLKILFVEYEPTWEWRFVKEVFHRDPLIGWEGFRTFLRSADFKVRRTNDLFLNSLIRPRSEFFSYDVIIVSDVPGDMLNEQFQQMLRDYVDKFGGGLVVLAGPRFGPEQLPGTKLADMLPVVIDPTARLRDAAFRLQLTPAARQYDFMQLGESPAESDKAWANLGELPWYQPVAKKHPLATVLAQHPTDLSADGKTHQPLIAIRRFGKGEVIYFGFNETWRLRRKYGEKYYRQLWGQIIYRLGLGRALGSQKRFLVQTDRRDYQAGDKVRVLVEAYDADFNPLKVDKLDARMLVDKAPGEKPAQPVAVTIPLARDKVIFETTLPVFTAGAHRLLVRDPVTGDEVEASFRVAPVTAERRSAVRNDALQNALAGQTGGKTFELTDLDKLADAIPDTRLVETTERRIELWNTWLVLLLVLGAMLTEWTARKLMNMR